MKKALIVIYGIIIVSYVTYMFYIKKKNDAHNLYKIEIDDKEKQ